MSNFRKISCGFLAGAMLLAGISVGSAAKPEVTQITPPKNVLILGNSFSFYNNGLHTFLRSMFRERGEEGQRYIFRIITTSGGYLEDAGFGFEQAIKRQYKWDTVIFQGNSDEPINEKKKAGFQEQARKLAQTAKANSLQIMYFATWAYPDKPEMTDQLINAYTAIANETGGMVSPVGLAFAKATADKPGIVLIMPDKRHPTVAGSYLAACTLYASMRKSSPEGLKYDADLGPEIAAFLQKTAWETAKAFYGW